MKDVLVGIEESKKNRIINAAIIEFSKNGFEKTSTNMIVKRAKVSKGLMYHYFASKQELYDYLIYYVFKLVIGEINEKLNFLEPDLFTRLKDISIIKIDIGYRYPNIYDLVPHFYRDKSIEEINQLVEEFSPNLSKKFYTENIDYSLFKDDIDVERALKIIQWTTEKISEETIAKLVNNEAVLDISQFSNEFDKYMIILRQTLYK